MCAIYPCRPRIQLDVHHVTRTWPARNDEIVSSEKVPIRNSYNEDKKVEAWNVMIEGTQPRLQEFKLSLRNS